MYVHFYTPDKMIKNKVTTIIHDQDRTHGNKNHVLITLKDHWEYFYYFALLTEANFIKNIDQNDNTYVAKVTSQRIYYEVAHECSNQFFNSFISSGHETWKT